MEISESSMVTIGTTEQNTNMNKIAGENMAAQTAVSVPRGVWACWNEAMKQLFVFNERSSRYEFWAFQSISLIVFLLMVICGQFFGEAKLVLNVFALYFLLPVASASVRRLHDLGLSGWWCVPAIVLALLFLGVWNFKHIANTAYVLFATLIYGTFLFWILCGRGEITDNKYGPAVVEPKESNLDSRAFMCFMFAFLIGLWTIFLTHIW
ncbi:MAG: DUF805 domain-containing protein [Alphaproteobacteria bacterium]|nr:DUF805 domain-containing protein [Alphaproteobacteria bacterium]